MEDATEKLPAVASYIERDFNEAWFHNADGIRSVSSTVKEAVAAGISPFKAEMSEYIKSLSVVKPNMDEGKGKFTKGHPFAEMFTRE